MATPNVGRFLAQRHDQLTAAYEEAAAYEALQPEAAKADVNAAAIREKLDQIEANGEYQEYVKEQTRLAEERAAAEAAAAKEAAEAAAQEQSAVDALHARVAALEAALSTVQG